jgi:BlaI family penicillinase repressor
MPRPKHEVPTPGELEVLKLLWRRGPSTVREVMDELNAVRPRAYTSVMSLLNVMAEKGLVERKPHGRAFLYEPCAEERETLGDMVKDLLGRAFDGQADLLVGHLLEEAHPSSEELQQIRQAIEQYRREREGT